MSHNNLIEHTSYKQRPYEGGKKGLIESISYLIQSHMLLCFIYLVCFVQSILYLAQSEIILIFGVFYSVFGALTYL